MNKLEEKVAKYLHKRGLNFAKGSVSYRGIMKDAEFPDGKKKDMHIVAFQVSSEMRVVKFKFVISVQMFKQKNWNF